MQFYNIPLARRIEIGSIFLVLAAVLYAVPTIRVTLLANVAAGCLVLAGILFFIFGGPRPQRLPYNLPARPLEVRQLSLVTSISALLILASVILLVVVVYRALAG